MLASPKGSYTIGIDLGGTQIKVIGVTHKGDILEREARDTLDRVESMPNRVAAIRERIARFEQAQGTAPAHIGLACPGLAAPGGGRIEWLPGKLHGLEKFDWSEALGRPVPVLNDAHAALLGEAWIGAAAGLRNLILLTLGTGVGGAILIDGRLYQGTIGRAGHLGHMSLDPEGPGSIVGMPGALEVQIGNCTISERSHGRFHSTEDLVRAVKAGDSEAGRVWRKSVQALAAAIASFINILDPEAVVIAGGIAQAGPDLFDLLETEIARVEWRPGGHRVPILPAKLGRWAGAIGAARYAIEYDTRSSIS